VAWVGGLTALFAATIGLAQNDIKRVLAYSTVSQLGYMFLALGVGAFTAGIFHLMTHAFFKALLFLGAGSVIHALSDEQDLRRMGGLAGRLPWTHFTMLMATLAIAGLPPFSGFFSKDEILAGAFGSGHLVLWAMGMAGAFLTAFYMFRLYLLAFRGRSRLTHEAGHHLHESPPAMIAPLFVLAILSVVGGLVGPPLMEGGHPFARWLAPVLGGAEGAHEAHAMSAGTEILLMVLSVAIAAAGIAFAFRSYLWSPQTATRLRERLAGPHRALLNKYWVDEFYQAAVVGPLHGTAQALWRFWDTKVVDGFVNGVGATLEGASAVLRLVQTGFVNTYALLFSVGVLALLLHFLRRP
jgi:NADH-quinone oxidoreductase subunit L